MKKVFIFILTLNLAFGARSQFWSITGNSGISPDSNFLGTTDTKPLLLRVNNLRAGMIHPTNSNTAFGQNTFHHNIAGGYNTAMGNAALSLNSSGYNNTATGYASLYSNTMGVNNTANGHNALYYNTNGHFNTATGSHALYYNTSGRDNTATGLYALLNNTSGRNNTATGVYALVANSTGSYNTAHGFWALHNNTASDNSAFGTFSLVNNRTGTHNVASGTRALQGNFSGSQNAAHGAFSLFTNNSGSYNTGVGTYALYSTSASYYNTAVGYRAGADYNLGWNNTFLGAYCGANAAGMYNSIAIGQAVTNTASSQARIGNSSTNSIGGYANWTNISDGRYKKNINQNVKGLEFIMKLQPVTYQLDISGLSNKLNEARGEENNEFSQKAMREKEKILFSGFVAQDVEKVAKETGYDFSGVDKPKNENDLYGLRYAEFVVPLVKAVQEQQDLINALVSQNAELQKRITMLEKNAGINFQASDPKEDGFNIWPNPSHELFFIDFVAGGKSQGTIKVFDSKGSLVKQQQAGISMGPNQIRLDLKGLPAGTYHLSAEWNNGLVRKTVQLVKRN